MKKLFTLLIFLVLSNAVWGQTSLNSGDIAIIGIDTPGEDFSFVTFVALDAGTEIYFTDEEGDGDYTIGTGEGTVLYTAPAGGITAGSVITYVGNNSNFTTTSDGTLALGNSGDNLIAYQGTSVGNVTTFLHAVADNGVGTGTFPDGFSNIVLINNDDGEYSGTRTGSAVDLMAAINNNSNWTTSGSGVLPFDTSSFTISTGGVNNPTDFTATASSDSQINLSWTLNVSGNNVVIAVNSSDTFGDPSGTYSVLDPITGGGTVIYNSNGTSYNHTGLTENTTYYYKAWSVDGTNTYSTGVTSNATTLKLEPTNYPTGPSAATGSPSHSSINVTWTDATGGTVPDGYLVKGSETSFAAIVDPIDGTAEADGGLVLNVANGVQSATFSGLNSETSYYFQIYPYTNSGSNINYKVGSEPQASATTDAAPVLPNVLFSEYVEGSSNNKALEIINLSGSSIDFSSGNYVIIVYANGSSSPTYTIDLTGLGTISDGDVGVIVNSATPIDANLLTLADITGNLFYNGDDAVTLEYLGEYLDIIGQVGTDPGSVWGTGDDVTADRTLRRKGTVTIGDRNGSDSFDPSVEWDSFAQDTFSGLGDPAPLPVELTSFSALAQRNTVNLTWETATEVNNYGFEIERTVVGTTHELSLQWAKVGFVEGHGNSNSAKQYTYVDNSVRAGQSYSYRLKQIDFDGQFEYSNIVNVEVGVPMEFSLAQNYPNPFNPSTSIEYSVPSNEFVTLKVYDVLGNTVSTLVNETKEAGKYNVSFEASNLTSGIYFYSINAGGFTQVKKMMLVK